MMIKLLWCIGVLAAYTVALPLSERQELRNKLLDILSERVEGERKCPVVDPFDMNVVSPNAPGPLEINQCQVNELKQGDRGCEDIDTSKCQTECKLGYETNYEGCVISCRCKTSGLFDGDIMMNAEHVKMFLEDDSANRGASRWFRRWDNLRQPDGTYNVPYEFHSSILENPRARKAILDAMAQYAEETCLRFVPRSYESDYLYIHRGRGCWSYIGRNRGKQPVSIGRGCEWKGIVMHEFMHAMGFFHEQSRPDRDSYVRINFENIRKGMEGNFQKMAERYVDSMGSPYDMGSVMHYGGYSFSKNRKPTIVSVATGKPVVRQRNGFSVEDAKQLNMMYKCKNYNYDYGFDDNEMK